MRIGIDVGGVLIEKSYEQNSKEDTQFVLEDVKWTDGAVDCITKLQKDGHELFIISYCGAKRELET